MSTDAAAWMMGWRWFVGTTQGGADLDDVVCPTCAGTRAPAEEPWDVGCNTCDWAFSNDWDVLLGDEPLTSAKDAVIVGREHRCESEVWVMDPDHSGSRPLQDYDRDGNLRKP